MPHLELSISDAARELAGGLDFHALFERAEKATEWAYAPQSELRVGAAIQTRDGAVVTGGNVENDSYGLTICAERSAVVRAVAEGHRDFAAIAVAAASNRVRTVASCGACLQVLAEFDPDQKLLVAFPDGEALRVALLSELLPVRFQFAGEVGSKDRS